MFEKEGYFSKDLVEEQEANRVKHDREYSLAFEIMETAYAAGFAAKIHDPDFRETVIWAVYCKLMDTYNAILILSTKGLESDARSLLRVMIEEVGIIGSLLEDEQFIEYYALRGDYDTYELYSEIRKHPEQYSETVVNLANGTFFEELSNHLDEKNYKKLKHNVSLEACVSKTGLETLFYQVYPLLCRDVHSNIKKVKDYWDLSDDGKIESINPLPKFNDQDFILITAMFLLLQALNFIESKYKSLGPDGLTILTQKWNLFMQEINTN